MVGHHFITNLVASISAQVAAEISCSPRTSPAKQDVAKPGRRVDLTPMATPPGANAAVSPKPVAITTESPATTLRITVVLPRNYPDEDYQRWG